MEPQPPKNSFTNRKKSQDNIANTSSPIELTIDSVDDDLQSIQSIAFSVGGLKNGLKQFDTQSKQKKLNTSKVGGAKTSF